MYLSKVYRQWRLFFWAILVFIAGQFFFMFKGIQNIPFFLYHMFSTTHAPADSMQVFLVKTPQGYFNTNKLSGREREMLLNNLGSYFARKAAAFKDPLEPTVHHRFGSRWPGQNRKIMSDGLLNSPQSFSSFPAWWRGYFNKIQNNHFDSIQVVAAFVYPGKSIQVREVVDVFTVANVR